MTGSNWREGGWPLLVTIAVLLLSAGVHLWWLSRFREGYPLDIDESRYVEFSLSLKDRLGAEGVDGLWRAWESQGDFGPLLPLSSMPLHVALGDSLMNAFATQLAFFAVLVMASYGIGARLTTPAGGALVATAVATTPAVIDFTRTYQLAVTAAALLTACTFALLASDGLSRRSWSVGWGVLLGFTVLARTMTLAFVPAQLLAAGWLALRRPGARRERLTNLAIGAGVALLTASTWLATSWRSVWDYLTDLGYGSESAGFGPSRSRLEVGYWTAEAADAIEGELYLPLAVVLTLAFVLGLVAFVRRIVQEEPRTGLGASALAWSASDAAVVLLVVVEAYLALTSSRNEGVGFRLILIPGVAALAVAALWAVPWRRARSVLVAALIAVSALNFAMKANVVDALSETETVDVPALGDTPVLDGRSHIEEYVVGALEARSPPATEPLAESQRRWLPAYEEIAAEVRSVLRTEGATRLAGLATSEPLINVNNVRLAGRMRFEEGLPVVLLAAPIGPQTLAAYRRVLSRPPALDVLITVSRLGVSYPELTGGTSIDQDLLRRAAASLGFVRVTTVRLPNQRSAIVMGRSG